MKLLLVTVVLVAGARAESKEGMQPQCMCSDFNPCYEKAKDTVQECADHCKNHLTDLGADYDKARKCIVAHQERIQKAADCSRKALGEMCTDKPGQEVPKRFTETLQLAAFREITDMATKSGLLGKATDLFDTAKKATTCMLKCARETDCAKKLKCGVILAPDNDVVAKVKKCALDEGFTTPIAREICTCIQKSGLKQLEPICPSLTIN